MKRFLLILTVLPALLMGCAKDGAENGGGKVTGEIIFSPTTYADDITQYDWEADERVGMFMTRNGALLNHENTKNAEYKYVVISPTSGELKSVVALNTLAIPRYSVNFVSYKPYKPTLIADGYKFVVDVNSYLTYKNIDLVYSNEKDVYMPGERDVELKYYHMMSKLLLRFSSDDPAKLTALTQDQIWIKGMPTKVTYNMLTETYEDLTGDDVDITRFNLITTTPADPKVKVFEVIVPPQPDGWSGVAKLRKVDYLTNSVTKSKAIHWGTPFKQGMVYSFDINLDEVIHEVIIDDPLVTPWGLGSINEFAEDEITGYFLDGVFKKWVQDTFCGGRTEIYREDLENVTEIEIRKSELTGTQTIKTLAGIEFFPKLTKLDVSNNSEGAPTSDYGFGIEHINVSANPLLTSLTCFSNQLTSLDVSKNAALIALACHSNSLTSLDVSGAVALTLLNCHNNLLTSLDMSKNTALIYLWCHKNQFISLDVSKNTKLTEFFCVTNLLTSLDVRSNTALTSLDCGTNSLTSLDVSKNTQLTSLSCATNLLTSLDVSKNTALISLWCHTNQLSSLDVRTNTALTSLGCGTNSLTSLDVSENTKLTILSCGSNILSSLDVKTNTALTNLDCNNTLLTSLDVSLNTDLIYLYCEINRLTSLDVSLNTALTHLNCSHNLLYILDISLNTALTTLWCSDNRLTSLDLSLLTISENSNIYFYINPGDGTTAGSPHAPEPAKFKVKLPAGGSGGGISALPAEGSWWYYRFTNDDGVGIGEEFKVILSYEVVVVP